jgi:8-oxo-dGTP diphosphatase
MQEYVLCLLYDKTSHCVALVHKIKPKWQAGKINGIGGKVEPGETPIAACSREFLEETGVDIPESEWRQFLTLTGEGFAVHTFVAFNDRVFYCKTIEDETIEIFNVKDIDYSKCVDNLKWIIPLSLSLDKMITTTHVVGE